MPKHHSQMALAESFLSFQSIRIVSPYLRFLFVWFQKLRVVFSLPNSVLFKNKLKVHVDCKVERKLYLK